MIDPCTNPTDQSNSARSRAIVVTVAWITGIAALALVRTRVNWQPYVAVHGWLASHGVPNWVRNLDSMIIYMLAACLGAWIAMRWGGTRAATALRLRRDDVDVSKSGMRNWIMMTLCACAPMVVGGIVLGLMRGGQPAFDRVIVMAVRAPMGEEFLFRGLLVGIPAVALGWTSRATRINIILASLLFGLTHITWTWNGLTQGWPALLVTFVGGVWYAWLLARWQLLWVPIVLHAGMNLGWYLAGTAGGAGGGGWIENLLRVATIVIATVWTIKASRSDAGIAR